MKDIKNKSLNEGDRVYFTYYSNHYIHEGTIDKIKFTRTGVKVIVKEDNGTITTMGAEFAQSGRVIRI